MGQLSSWTGPLSHRTRPALQFRGLRAQSRYIERRTELLDLDQNPTNLSIATLRPHPPAGQASWSPEQFVPSPHMVSLEIAPDTDEPGARHELSRSVAFG